MKSKESVESTEFEKHFGKRRMQNCYLLCWKPTVNVRFLTDTSSCFSDLSDSLNSLNSVKVPFYLGKHFTHIQFFNNARHLPSVYVGEIVELGIGTIRWQSWWNSDRFCTQNTVICNIIT